MSWYSFKSQNDFDSWHSEIKTQLGYPIPSKNADGEIIGEPFTTDYTKVIKVNDNDWRAWIDDQYASGLTLSTEPIVNDEREIINPQS